jgi:hypothetical protein
LETVVAGEKIRQASLKRNLSSMLLSEPLDSPENKDEIDNGDSGKIQKKRNIPSYESSSEKRKRNSGAIIALLEKDLAKEERKEMELEKRHSEEMHFKMLEFEQGVKERQMDRDERENARKMESEERMKKFEIQMKYAENQYLLLQALLNKK